VEGALDTAESALEDHFGVGKPTWLSDPNYALMPNPCPGCGDLEGCVEFTNATNTLNAITPNCLKAVQEG
jgi:hypothetical protein